MAYAKLLTRDYLEYLGITEVSEDGTKIMKGDKEIPQHDTNEYKTIILYDPAVRQVCPKDKRTNTTGQFMLGVHRVVYTWYHKVVSEGLVIDHIDNNKHNNALSNLQALTPSNNIWKERECNVRESKCKLNKPRSFYENKLESYIESYEQAKLDKEPELCKKLRANIANTRARLRYYDSHIEEYENFKITKENLETMKFEKTQDKRNFEILVYWKKVFKDAGNKEMWHQCCKVERMWKNGELTDQLKEHVINTLCGLKKKETL